MIPGKVSGQPIVKGTRILADGVVVNAESGLTPEEIADEIFPGLGVERGPRGFRLKRLRIQFWVFSETQRLRASEFITPQPRALPEPAKLTVRQDKSCPGLGPPL